MTELQMQLVMGQWSSVLYSMNAHLYPPGNSTRHPQESWHSLRNTALTLGSGYPGSHCQRKPGRTRVWSAVSVIPRDWPVSQGCLLRHWGRIRVNKKVKSGNIQWDAKFVKKGGKSLLLGEMLHSLEALEFKITCSQTDLFSTFCPLKQALLLIESTMNWSLQGSHRSS